MKIENTQKSIVQFVLYFYFYLWRLFGGQVVGASLPNSLPFSTFLPLVRGNSPSYGVVCKQPNPSTGAKVLQKIENGKLKMENYGAPAAQSTVDRQITPPYSRVAFLIPVNKGGRRDRSDRRNRRNKNPVFPVFLVFLVFPLGRPSRLFFFATFGGKSGAKATHHISGGVESRKA